MGGSKQATMETNPKMPTAILSVAQFNEGTWKRTVWMACLVSHAPTRPRANPPIRRKASEMHEKPGMWVEIDPDDEA